MCVHHAAHGPSFKRRSWMRYRPGIGLLVLTGAGLVAAACGGGEASPTMTAVPVTPFGSPPAATVVRATPPATAAEPTSAGTPVAISTLPADGLTLVSDAFTNNGAIPREYSCDGAGTSPPLAWSGAPPATKSFALIVVDPDAPVAGGVTHWVLFDLPATATGLPAGVPPGAQVPGGGTQGVSIGGGNGYRGMCPPAGGPAHGYRFRLYALDGVLGLPAAATRADVEAAVQGRVLAEVELVGTYAR